jgi:hypothetical protein
LSLRLKILNAVTTLANGSAEANESRIDKYFFSSQEKYESEKGNVDDR